MRLRLLLLAPFSVLLMLPASFADEKSDPATQQHPHELLLSTLWVRTSGEYYASAVQAYRTAQFRLDEGLKDPEWTADPNQKNPYTLPPAVILDLDETVIDNSGFEVSMIEGNSQFTPALWTAWVNQSAATAIPGALDFIRYAHSRGVRIFYVTNRKAHEEEATRVNLKRLGIPLDDTTDEILTRGEQPDWTSDKATRRRILSKEYRTLLYIGDNMNDFVSGVRVTPQARMKIAAKHKERWGKQWIVIPNPIYGTWEQSLYDFNYKLSYADKVKRKHHYLNAPEVRP